MHKDNVLTEAGASNVFFTKNDVICTPKLSKSILPGITRSLLIDELNKAKLPIIEGIFSLEDLSETITSPPPINMDGRLLREQYWLNHLLPVFQSM